jgi:hypothetical protein
VNVFDYIAYSRPNEAMKVVHDFGYKFTGAVTKKDLSKLLGDLVMKEGEPAMKAILAIHPDKDVIVEQFGGTASDCGCNKTGKLNATGPSTDSLLASASLMRSPATDQMATMESRKLASLNGALVVSAAIIISTLIFTSLKK